MACNCGTKITTGLVCSSCGTESSVRHLKRRDPIEAAEMLRLVCKECGDNAWQTA